MSELRSIVERELARIDPPPFTIDGFHRRRARKDRNRRLASGAVALAVMIAAVGLVIRAFAPIRRPAPAMSVVVPKGSIAFVGRGVSWKDDASLFVFDPNTRRVTKLVDLHCSISGQIRSCPGVLIDGVAWSPDGTRIAYSLHQSRGWSGREPTWTMDESANGIYVLDLRTGRTRHLTHCAGFDCRGSLAWSPDGSTIAYGGSSAGTPSIWTMAADGSSRARLATGARLAEDPSWSPDGRRIAFASGSTLFTVATDGSELRPLDIGPGPSGGDGLWAPAWSPDGTTIAFLERTGGPQGRLWVSRIGSSSARPVAAFGSDQELSAPSWSLDGSRIAVIADGWLYVVRADGTGLTRLTRAWSPVAPAWYPGR